jgi:hypothetical protein
VCSPRRLLEDLHRWKISIAGRSPSLEDLRGDFRSAMRADVDESFAMRMRQRHPPFVTPAPQAAATQLHERSAG